MAARRDDRLGAVLRVRRVQEEIERARVAAATAAEEQARNAVADRRAALRAADPTQRVLVELGWSALDRARIQRATAMAELDARRAEWSIAQQRVKGLERLVERRADEARRERNRRELALADDLVSARSAR